MDKTKVLNIFRSMCMMLAIMAILALLALGIVNFVRLPESAQIGVGLIIIFIIGTGTIYSVVYGSLSYDYNDDDYDFGDEGRYD